MTAEGVLARLAAAVGVRLEVEAGAGWAGAGEGGVSAACDGAVLVVSESGTWAPEGGRPMRWTARSRWRTEGAALAVAHDRQGVPASAVLDGDGRQWTARTPHLCAPDAYSVALAVMPDEIVVTWTVTGPRKDDRIVTRYR